MLTGFEHVFLGEIDDGKVKGSHNWIWFYQMEKKGLINYQVKVKDYSIALFIDYRLILLSEQV